MAEKEPIIVIKKITINGAGHHGGAWKVAFADFMTAMMAFFLVMWLISQSDEVKKNVADYFSTPSIVEYNFSNYGVELTLEKLFLDLINEPLKFFESFIKPTDYTPNIMAMGSKKIVLHHIADQLSDVASGVEVSGDKIEFTIDDKYLFLPGTSKPNSQFVDIMDKVKTLTAGLEDSNVYVTSVLYSESVDDRKIKTAKNIAEERLDLVSAKIEVGLEHETVDMFAKTDVSDYALPLKGGEVPRGKLVIRVKQKDFTKDGKKQREIQELFGDNDDQLNIYQNFVKKVSERKEAKPGKTK